MDICEVDYVDAGRVARAQRLLPSSESQQALADIFKLLGDPTRLSILSALTASELCVCDLASLLDASSSAISHQLRLLRGAGLVRYRKAGKMAYYRLATDQLEALLAAGRKLAVASGTALPLEPAGTP